MFSATQIHTQFRRVDKARYPEVAAYTWDEIYGCGDRMAPGGLYLAAEMARAMTLTPGDIVLDLGCGRGDTSIFLAKHFDVSVVSVDHWISATERHVKFTGQGYRNAIMPLRLDVTRGLPFAEDYFDAIFCMQAFHAFEGSVAFLRHLLAHLKPGGQLCIGGTCFNEEAPNGTLPAIYHETDGWDAEYRKYHSPAWWRDLFREAGSVTVLQCHELDDGRLLWEDELLYSGERAGWSDAYLQQGEWLINQLHYGRHHRPYLTHYLALLEKQEPTTA